MLRCRTRFSEGGAAAFARCGGATLRAWNFAGTRLRVLFFENDRVDAIASSAAGTAQKDGRNLSLLAPQAAARRFQYETISISGPDTDLRVGPRVSATKLLLRALVFANLLEPRERR